MDNNNALVEALVALKPFLSKVGDNSIAISSIDNRLVLVMEEMKKVSRILYEGNGQPPFTARIASLETSMEQVRDMLKEDKETLSKLLHQIQIVDKASIDIGVALEEYQVSERGRLEKEKAKDLVDYQWKLNVIQAVFVVIITSLVGFVGTEIYSYLKGQPSNQSTQQAK